MKQLSKSRYTAYCQCEKNLWLRVYRPEEAATVDSAAQARFNKGSEVGELTKQLFDGTEDATVRNSDGSLDLAAMMERTHDLMNAHTPCIAEAAFAYEGCYCAVDLLRREGDGWALYEVKSTSNGEEKKYEKYLPDIAYQTWVLTQLGVRLTGVNLVCLNSGYVRCSALDVEQLFAVVDMREAIADELAKVPVGVAAALRTLARKEEPVCDLSAACAKPYECAFLAYCKRLHGIPDDHPTVFDLYRTGTAKAVELCHKGIITFEDIREQKLTDIQRMQVECTIEGKEHVEREGIRRFLDGLSYPLYFLDFETMQDAVPQYDGTRPYQQVPFQYSLHIKRSADAPYEHLEYLAPSDGCDPRRGLAEALCRDIPRGVCTLAYNDPFEKGRIRELADAYPDLAEHLMDIHDHIQDLLVPFRQGCYYVPAMGGSFSIKSVLPALFPNDTELDYHNLGGNVHNGGEAMSIFPLIKDMPLADAQVARQALLDYCCLDTWAMVKVWEKMVKIRVLNKK